ncbi:MAG TPA: MFS transporter [Urbifossiella sp.]|jgi:sugar phosphate permease|nr:MFS transporter [Urbifossiella sp.]
MPQRYLVVGITAVAALWMYIDRVCFSTLADPAQTDLGLTDEQKEYMLGAFFLTYALFQIPMGSLADRFGQRLVLTLSIAAWSVVTALTGFVEGFATLLVMRLLLGVTESGAYPAAAGLVKSWARPQERGRFSSIVALGGRVGGASAPALTAVLAVALAGVALTGTWDTPSGVNWRGVLFIYGLCGIVVAAVFWLFIRDRPPAPAPMAKKTDDAGGWAEAPPAAVVAPLTFEQRLRILARSRNMWLCGGAQFGVNVGWAFVVTLLPSYLNQVFGVPLEKRGEMQSVVLYVGCTGMVLGGVVTDALRKRLGPRLGRSVPIGTTLGGCAAAMFLIPALPTPWAVVAALGVMAFLVDLHNPSIWSFAQDVGGRNVGAALGWGNMWGNLGAAVSPRLLGAVARSAGWDAAFILSGVLFAAAAVCGFLLDATKPVEPEA